MVDEFVPSRGGSEVGRTETRLGQLMARRGVVLVKELRQIGDLTCDARRRLAVGTIVLRSAAAPHAAGSLSRGVRFKILEDGQGRGTAVLDHEELPGFCEALAAIIEAAGALGTAPDAYTEASYLTRDGVQCGFFQTVEGDRRAFLRLGSEASAVFLPIESLNGFRKLVEEAREQLG